MTTANGPPGPSRPLQAAVVSRPELFHVCVCVCEDAGAEITD